MDIDISKEYYDSEHYIVYIKKILKILDLNLLYVNFKMKYYYTIVSIR